MNLRWHGFDLVRLLSFFAIVTFHTSLFYFYTPTIEYAEVSPIVGAADAGARALAFSGFTIVFLSSLLLAFSKRSIDKAGPFFLVLLGGWIMLSMLMNDDFFLVWDVYTLFLAAMTLVLFLHRRGLAWVRGLGMFGFALLWLPMWKLHPYFLWVPEPLQHMIGVASCQGREINEWPLIPWVGLVWLGYGIGAELSRLKDENRLDQLKLGKRELLLWIPLLCASLPQWGAYYNIRLGEYFACDAYRQEPYVFWSHFLWVMAALRLSVDPRIQAWLSRQRWAHAISDMAISRKFWLAYIVHYLWGNIVAYLVDQASTRIPGFYDTYELLIVEFFSMTLLIQAELLTRAVLRVSSWTMRHWTRHQTAPKNPRPISRL